MNSRWTSAAVAGTLLAVAAWSGAASPLASRIANTYELKSRSGLFVGFSSTSFTGDARFRYVEGKTDLSFRGDEIRIEETSLGTLATVRLEDVPDLEGKDFTLVVPRVNVEDGGTESVASFGFWTLQRTTIGGPDLVDGQVQSYRTVGLRGTAQALDF